MLFYRSFFAEDSVGAVELPSSGRSTTGDLGGGRGVQGSREDYRGGASGGGIRAHAIKTAAVEGCLRLQVLLERPQA